MYYITIIEGEGGDLERNFAVAVSFLTTWAIGGLFCIQKAAGDVRVTVINIPELQQAVCKHVAVCLIGHDAGYSLK